MVKNFFYKILFLFILIFSFFVVGNCVYAYDYQGFLDVFDNEDYWTAEADVVSDIDDFLITDNNMLKLYFTANTLTDYYWADYGFGTTTQDFIIEFQFYCPESPPNGSSYYVQIDDDQADHTPDPSEYKIDILCGSNGITTIDIDDIRQYLPSGHFYKIRSIVNLQSNTVDYSLFTGTTTIEDSDNLGASDNIIQRIIIHSKSNGGSADDYIIFDNMYVYGYLDNSNIVLPSYQDFSNICWPVDDCADISYPLRLPCWDDTYCDLDIIYNNSAKNGTLYLVRVEDYDTYEYDYEYVSDLSDMRNEETLVIAPRDEGLYKYRMLLHTPLGNVKSYELEVIFSHYIEPDIGGWNCDDPCNGLATSTLEYAFHCGLRHATCFAFYPASSSILALQADIRRLDNNFPMSVYNQMSKEMIEDSYWKASSTSIVIPFEAGTIDLGDYLNSDSLKFFGQDMFDKYWFLAEAFIYISVAGYFIFRFLHI